MDREMTEAESQAAEAADKTLAGNKESPVILDSDGELAGYKIEITFGKDRSSLKPCLALVSLWESGKNFDGGGDSLMYYCFDCEGVEPRASWKKLLAVLDKKIEAESGCGGPIPAAAIIGGIAMCPGCSKIANAERLTGQFPFFGTTKELAVFTARYYRTLKSNADIYCKYHPLDIRYKSMEQAKGLEVARRLKGMFIYPMKSIWSDTIAGASLESRFTALFNA